MPSSRPATPATNGDRSAVQPQSKPSKRLPELDLQRLNALPAEQQELFLFNYQSALEQRILSLNGEDFTAEQAELKQILLKLTNLRIPSPNRVSRASTSRCFAILFQKGDRKQLFETVNELVELVLSGKVDKEVKNKHAAVVCLGEIYRVVEHGAASLAANVVITLLKTIKGTSNYLSLKRAVFDTLAILISTIGSSLEETLLRDIWKQARTSAGGDKSYAVQVAACRCLEQIYGSSKAFNTNPDFESLKSTIWKVADSSSSRVRHAAADCLAVAMLNALGDASAPVPIPKTPLMKKKRPLPPTATLAREDDEDSDASRVSSPSWRKTNYNLELDLVDILQTLQAQYTRSSCTTRQRVCIVSTYIKVLRGFDGAVIVKKHGEILQHLLFDLVGHPAVTSIRYRSLFTRRAVHKILVNVVGLEILRETARLELCKSLVESVLKNYPKVLPEIPEPTKPTLVATLEVLTALVSASGSAASSISALACETLIRLLHHTSYSVQIHAAHCLTACVSSNPQLLLSSIDACSKALNDQLALLVEEKTAARKAIGIANGLAGVLSVFRHNPLNGSLESIQKVLHQSIRLLKSSATVELRVSGVQIQVAWILLGALMTLGPNFVKVQLNQMLLLWRNALPKPLPSDNTKSKGGAELSYLLHVRECALGCAALFLTHDSRLVTNDVALKLATCFRNTLEFLEEMSKSRPEQDVVSQGPSLRLADITQMVRRRVLQCFYLMASNCPAVSSEILHDLSLLNFTLQNFAELSYQQSSLGASLATSASTFDGLWSLADGIGFGVNGMVSNTPNLTSTRPLEDESNVNVDLDYSMDYYLTTPICGAKEHDSISLYLDGSQVQNVLPDPPATAVVNYAICLFACIMPLQEPRIQESILEQVTTYLSPRYAQKDPGRRAAITINVVTALRQSLKVSLGETAGRQGSIRHASTERLLETILKALLLDSDSFIRHAACEAVGSLCNGASTGFITALVNSLVDIIVANREPAARAGCALALGYIHANVGGMAASFHLRKIHGVLMSLCSDINPMVHNSAIRALSKIAESAGLAFSAYMPSTLGLLTQIWTLDSHSNDSDVVTTSNSELEASTPAEIANSIGICISVLGPDLPEMRQAKELILSLVASFEKDPSVAVRTSALQCWAHIQLYAPSLVNLQKYTSDLQAALELNDFSQQMVALEGLHQLLQTNPEILGKFGNEGLEKRIWDLAAQFRIAKFTLNMIDFWVERTSLTQTDQWVTRCQKVLTRTVVQSAPSLTDNQNEQGVDEEVAGFNVNGGASDDSASAMRALELLPWQIRTHAVRCACVLVNAVSKASQSNVDLPAYHILQLRVADLIRLAFLASTSTVSDLRQSGLNLIDLVLKVFGETPDPDFSQALLLEQYQAQISSALTPALAADSTPELASAAINVCATFITTGLVKDIDRMGRILKVLVSAIIESSVSASSISIGELKDLSPNAQRMLKMSVLSAWAHLQIASSSHEYLEEVVRPHLRRLTPMWLSSLQDYAQLQFQPDISDSMMTSPTDSLDVVYAAMNRQTLLKFYQKSWLILVEAIASLIEQGSGIVYDALDRRNTDNNKEAAHDEIINYRDEPVAFFFILFGISMESLMSYSSRSSALEVSQMVDILHALKRVLQPSISGNAIYQEQIFSETIELFDRLVQTEDFEVQGAIVEMIKDLCLNHPCATSDTERGQQLSDDIEQLFEMTRVIMIVVTNMLPTLNEKIVPGRQELSEDAVNLLILALDSLVDACQVFPSVIKADLNACIFHISTTILGTGVCQLAVVPRLLPIFRRFLQQLNDDEDDDDAAMLQLVVCLNRLRQILSFAQRRETEGSLQCARSVLAASVIVLSSGSLLIPEDEPALFALLDDILDCLSDVGLGRIAANCIKSLLNNNPGIRTNQAIHSHVLPKSLQFILSTEAADSEGAKPILLNGLVAHLQVLGDEAMRTMMCILIPTIAKFASAEGDRIYESMSSHLLSMAALDQLTFKSIIGNLKSSHKEKIEAVLRSAALMRANKVEAGVAAPSIALKMNFGS